MASMVPECFVFALRTQTRRSTLTGPPEASPAPLRETLHRGGQQLDCRSHSCGGQRRSNLKPQPGRKLTLRARWLTCCGSPPRRPEAVAPRRQFARSSTIFSRTIGQRRVGYVVATGCAHPRRRRIDSQPVWQRSITRDHQPGSVGTVPPPATNVAEYVVPTIPEGNKRVVMLIKEVISRFSPRTVVGSIRGFPVPSPRSPWSLSPQHLTEPDAKTAQMCEPTTPGSDHGDYAFQTWDRRRRKRQVLRVETNAMFFVGLRGTGSGVRIDDFLTQRQGKIGHGGNLAAGSTNRVPPRGVLRSMCGNRS